MPEILKVGAGIEKHGNGPSPDGAHHHEGEGRGNDGLDENFPENVHYVCCGDGCSLGDVPSDEKPEEYAGERNAHPHSDTHQINDDENRKGDSGVQSRNPIHCSLLQVVMARPSVG